MRTQPILPGHSGGTRPSDSSEAVGFSHGDFGFVVETLNHTAGKESLNAEIVEDQLTVL